MNPTDSALDEALRPLAGVNLYRANIFRISGLPTSATAAQVNSRRREATMLAKLGTAAPPPRAGELPLPSPPDEEALRAAFEALRDPVTRFVHEVLWLWGGEKAAAHDEAIRAHCTALEEERPGEPRSPAELERLDQLWRQALKAWASVLYAARTWDRPRQRVREIDDPRLTIGTLRRLEARLPLHVVTTLVELAARTAELDSEDAADRYLELLDDSPFGEDLVEKAVLAVSRTAEERVFAACTAAENMVVSSSESGLTAARTLIDRATPQLRVVSALLGPDNPATSAVHDAVAAGINQCAVAYWNAKDQPPGVVALLREAQDLARESTTSAQISRNLNTCGSEFVLVQVLDLCKAKDVDGAADRLRAWRERTTDPELDAHLGTLLDDPFALRGPIQSAPFTGNVFGIGVTAVGQRARAADGSYIATYCFTIIFLLIPMAAYHRDARYVYAKVPLSRFARWWRVAMLVLLPTLFALVFLSGTAALWVGALAGITAGVALLARQKVLSDWVAERSAMEEV
ncbi:hypothetical protein GCM10010174_18100 [Kutzneria viridogrisea]|uniref:Uncharacterized protein n=2 Tax=Kutzneria TaxID=43356 RepID=W5WN79_9PSEU|nr:hypothetical protein [Kutzneria albida]AHH99614.1 hypothetical protein KALB_6254 [Kutzneria albida DSM 43870]MBA8922830.1 hypothetical protein [Kutzneria viridogrisea]